MNQLNADPILVKKRVRGITIFFPEILVSYPSPPLFFIPYPFIFSRFLFFLLPPLMLKTDEKKTKTPGKMFLAL